jgi:hypothetical protein
MKNQCNIGSISDYTALHCKVTYEQFIVEDLEVMAELRYYPGICVQELTTMKNINQNSQ